MKYLKALQMLTFFTLSTSIEDMLLAPFSNKNFKNMVKLILISHTSSMPALYLNTESYTWYSYIYLYIKYIVLSCEFRCVLLSNYLRRRCRQESSRAPHRSHTDMLASV